MGHGNHFLKPENTLGPASERGAEGPASASLSNVRIRVLEFCALSPIRSLCCNPSQQKGWLTAIHTRKSTWVKGKPQNASLNTPFFTYHPSKNTNEELSGYFSTVGSNTRCGYFIPVGWQKGGRPEEKEIRDSSSSSANQKLTISKCNSEAYIQLEGTERSGWDLSANFWNMLCELLRPFSAQIKGKATRM